MIALLYGRDDVAFSGRSPDEVLWPQLQGVTRHWTSLSHAADNAFLAFDDVFGRLEDWGVGYVGRFGPWVISTVVDEDANIDLGAMFQRPLGSRDYRFTARYTEGVYTAQDGLSQFSTRALGVVGELVYGSALFDIGAGYERFSADGLTSLDSQDGEQWYFSTGVRLKLGILTYSLEGQYGQVEGDDKIAVAFGVQYDVARGLSANMGLNHENATANIGHVSFLDTRDTKAVLSLRYSF